MKRMSILKPYLHTSVLSERQSENAKYLKIPADMDGCLLEKDIKKGAKQFAELEKLVKKENEPQYILIATDNLEQVKEKADLFSINAESTRSRCSRPLIKSIAVILFKE